MLVCVFFAQFCTRDRGCSAHPAFPAPSDFKARNYGHNSGEWRREMAKSCPSSSLRGALATKQSILPLCGAMDCSHGECVCQGRAVTFLFDCGHLFVPTPGCAG